MAESTHQRDLLQKLQAEEEALTELRAEEDRRTVRIALLRELLDELGADSDAPSESPRQPRRVTRAKRRIRPTMATGMTPAERRAHRVAKILEDGGEPMGPAEIVAAYSERYSGEVSKHNVNDTLRKLPDRFKRVGHGLWTLASLAETRQARAEGPGPAEDTES